MGCWASNSGRPPLRLGAWRLLAAWLLTLCFVLGAHYRLRGSDHHLQVPVAGGRADQPEFEKVFQADGLRAVQGDAG